MPRTIADLTEGSEIYIDETVNGTTEHTPYIYLGLDDYGKARVLRKYCLGTKRMHSSNSADYDGCEMDVFLENTETGFLSRFDAATINALVTTTIEYTDYVTDSAGVVSSVARRCFLLSYSEMGYGNAVLGNEGRSYQTALNTATGKTEQNARIGRTSNETAVNSWLRSGNSATQFRYVVYNGGASSGSASNANNMYYRPALSVAPATSVSDEGADYISLLPSGGITSWEIRATMSLGKCLAMPKKCKLVIPADHFETLNAWVCNNYGDENPTWVPCRNNGVATFGTSKTAADWELGVKVEAASSVIYHAIGEPAMIVEYADEE